MRRATLLALLLVGCGGGGSGTRRAVAVVLPSRGEGCEVEVVGSGMPSRPIRGVGRVVARCSGEVADDEARCMRSLEDQVCRLGATVVWNVTSTPMQDGQARELRGDAAIYR